MRTRTKTIVCAMVALVLASVSLAAAEPQAGPPAAAPAGPSAGPPGMGPPPPGPGGSPPGPEPRDPIEAHLFPPDIVMHNQGKIGLDDAQRNAIKEEVKKTQARILDLQWQVDREAEGLSELLGATPIAEAQVLDQSKKLMGIEQEIKQLHLQLLVRIKNVLRADQHEKIDEIRRAKRGPPPPQGPPPQGPPPPHPPAP